MSLNRESDEVLTSRNINPADIKCLSPMAKEWWNAKNGPMYTLHDMNKMRIDFVIEGLIDTKVLKPWQRSEQNVFQGLNFLDLGCGGGILVEALAKRKAQVTGLDPNEALLEVAKDHIAPQEDIRDNVRYLLETIEDHCVKYPNHYDAIVCSEVLEHVLDKKSLLDAAGKALKPGGSIFVTTFNKTYYSWFFAILWGEWILNVVPRGCHSYGLFVSPDDVMRILNASKCKRNKLRGTFYNPLCRVWHVHSWTGFHYIMQAVKDKDA